jgi:hypothetical protein
MAKEKVSFNASAGFMPFSLYDLQELWSNIRDGNYWSAFRKAIRILDGAVNPEAGRTRAEAWTPEIGEQIDECCAELEQWAQDFRGAVGSKVVTVKPQLSEPGADAVPIVEIISLVMMVVNFIREWRKRRAEPTPPQGARTGNLETAVNPPQRATRTPVFPSNVEVRDREGVSTNAGELAKNTADPKFNQPPQQPMTGNTPTPINPEDEPGDDDGDATGDEVGDDVTEGETDISSVPPQSGTADNPANLSQGGQSDAMRRAQQGRTPPAAPTPRPAAPRPATPARPAPARIPPKPGTPPKQ